MSRANLGLKTIFVSSFSQPSLATCIKKKLNIFIYFKSIYVLKTLESKMALWDFGSSRPKEEKEKNFIPFHTMIEFYNIRWNQVKSCDFLTLIFYVDYSFFFFLIVYIIFKTA